MLLSWALAGLRRPLPALQDPLCNLPEDEPTLMNQPTRPASERVFPLNLTPFEEYMDWDDRDEYPMTFIVELEFTGKLDRQALEAALPEALARHPLLRAWIGKGKGNRDGWIAAEQPNPKLDFGELGKPIDLPFGERIDLRKEVGLRIWVRYDDQRAIITTQFHHATCDGIGSYQFIGDWLWFYAQRVGQPVEEKLPDYDPAGPRARNRANYNPDDYRLPNGKIRPEYGELKEVVFKGAVPLSRPSPPKRAESFPGILSTEFNKDEYRSLRLAAESRGQSTNQLLIERLLITVDRWNEQHGQRRSGNYAIMMPMDLRQSGDPNFSAVNVVTYAFVRRSRAGLKDPEQLQDSLREEMVHLMHQRHGGPFMNMIASMRVAPRWFKRFLASKRCLSTAIISNTGDPTKRFNVQFPREGSLIRCGNLRLEDIRGVPPMRMHTRVTISVFTYRRVLKLCMRCDPNCFNSAATQQLLDLYRSEIESIIER